MTFFVYLVLTSSVTKENQLVSIAKNRGGSVKDIPTQVGSDRNRPLPRDFSPRMLTTIRLNLHYQRPTLSLPSTSVELDLPNRQDLPRTTYTLGLPLKTLQTNLTH